MTPLLPLAGQDRVCILPYLLLMASFNFWVPRVLFPLQKVSNHNQTPCSIQETILKLLAVLLITFMLQQYQPFPKALTESG